MWPFSKKTQQADEYKNITADATVLDRHGVIVASRVPITMKVPKRIHHINEDGMLVIYPENWSIYVNLTIIGDLEN